MIWNKVGFVIASQQRQEIFRLILECKSVKEIESKARITKNVRRMLRDFEREGLIKVKNEKIEITEIGRRVLEGLPSSVLC
jgi:predicted methyltransferase